jgi:catechol 2,3-dioxygenase-like lactoylglutathione lyase family enzyme
VVVTVGVSILAQRSDQKGNHQRAAERAREVLQGARRGTSIQRYRSPGGRQMRECSMSVRRVVPDLVSASLDASTTFYADVLGLRPVMNHGWIVTLAAPDQPAAQISVMTHDSTASVVPSISVQVDDIDACHAAAKRAGAEIVHPLTDEPWGVRRFFMRDPDGHVINVLSHP